VAPWAASSGTHPSSMLNIDSLMAASTTCGVSGREGAGAAHCAILGARACAVPALASAANRALPRMLPPHLAGRGGSSTAAVQQRHHDAKCGMQPRQAVSQADVWPHWGPVWVAIDIPAEEAGAGSREQRWEQGEGQHREPRQQRQQYSTAGSCSRPACTASARAPPACTPPDHSAHGRHSWRSRHSAHPPEAAVRLAHAGVARQLRLGPCLAIPTDAGVHKIRLQIYRPQLQASVPAQ
jgi:hypothetical protein